MQRPAPLEVEGEAMLELEYFLYNCGRTMTEYEDRGTVRVPAVLQCAWRYRQEGFAWILLNLSTEERRARLTLTPPAYGDAPSSRSALTRHEDPRPPEPLGVLDGARTLSLVLPPRVPVMVEALPLSGKARS
jgi:hypothetical protein